MSLYSYVVTRNETGRYFEEFLQDLSPYVDDLLVYDDRSSDIEKLRELCSEYDVPLVSRPVAHFSFVENESFFREQAWNEMVRNFDPTEDDWILTLDADEILRAPYPEYVSEYCQHLSRIGHNGLKFHIHEVWTPIEEPPQIRTDGFWGQVEGLRACRYQPQGIFNNTKLGGGSLPTYVDNVVTTSDIDILHYGYAKPEDRQTKYQRYHGRRGHNPNHISSILQTPTLAPLPPLTVEY